MTEDRWQKVRNLHQNLEPRIRYPMAETWDLKVFLPQLTSRFPVSL